MAQATSTPATPPVPNVVKNFQDLKPVPRPRDREDLDSCPVCGRLKDKTRTIGEENRTIQILTCTTCSRAYRAYCDEAQKAIIADPANAPEPMDKFSWVLRQIDLDRFQVEAAEAVTAYRTVYEGTVLSVLRQRRYLADEAEWATKDSALRRPKMRFTEQAFRSGTGEDIRKALEEKEEVYSLFVAMKKAAGRLEAASRVKPDLEAQLAKNAKAKAEAEASAELSS